MRRILVENARRKGRRKRGGDWRRATLSVHERAKQDVVVDSLTVDEALTELAGQDAKKSELVKLRYFAGMTLPEAAAILEISTPTAERYWRYARAWLARRLRRDDASTAT
jgi:RNA polymerase sigma factor (TIGR02999 family)